MILAFVLAFLREGPPHLLDQLLGFVERGAGVGRAVVAAELRLQAQEVGVNWCSLEG